MNRYNKLPHKERKRQAQYRLEQPEKQEKAAYERETKRLIKSKTSACRDMSDKEREEYEVFERLKRLMTEGQNEQS